MYIINFIFGDNFETVLDAIDQFLYVLSFLICSVHFGFKKGSESLNWFNIGNVKLVVEFLYENDVLLEEVSWKRFAVMTTGQIWQEYVITAFGGRGWDNGGCTCSTVVGFWQRTPTFKWTDDSTFRIIIHDLFLVVFEV